MEKDYNEIIVDIHRFLSKLGGYYSDYYVGITNDIERRLFDEHKVINNYIYRTGKSDEITRAVEKYYLDKGCKGGAGGGDEDSKIVYCYKITKDTEQ